MRLLKVMQRQDNYLQESYSQARAGGVPVSLQEERYSQKPDHYSSEPSSTTSSLPQRTQPQNRSYVSQQSQVKVVSKVEQTNTSFPGNIYKENRKGYPNETQDMRTFSRDNNVALSQQPRPLVLYENQSGSSSQLVQPSQPVMSSTQITKNLQTTNIFYENTVNKDSELQLSMKERQNLMNESSANNMDIISVEEVVSTQDANSKLDRNLDEADASDLSERPISSDKTHVCMTCFKAFKNKPQLNQHELVHNGIRKHICSYCDKSFKQLCHLNQHIRTHTGERPYKCNVEGCGRSFAQLSNLHHHQKNHEEHVKRDLSRQFRCVICDRSYANESSLRTHTLKLHVNLKSPEDGAPAAPPTKKRKKKQSADPQNLITVNLSSDEEGPPSQVKIEYSHNRPSNQISPTPSHQISPQSSSQIPASSLNQSARNFLESSQNEAISQILQKRLLADATTAEILRSTAVSQQLSSPPFTSIDSGSRQDQNIITQYQPLPKVTALAHSIQQQDRGVFRAETYNPDRSSQTQLQ